MSRLSSVICYGFDTLPLATRFHFKRLANGVSFAGFRVASHR